MNYLMTTAKFSNNNHCSYGDIGFTEFQYQELIRFIETFPDIELVKVFGSRAMGTYKKGSDADLVVFGDNVSYETITALSYVLNEESILPYYFDVLAGSQISSEALIKHIDELGKVIYRQ